MENRRERITVGEDEIARTQREMGLEINPETGRAYESQGTFTNSAGGSGRFRDGLALPKSSVCGGCEKRVTEDEYGQGFRNCGEIILGGRGAHFLCSECLARALLKLSPVVMAIRATGSGLAITGTPYDCKGCGGDLRKIPSFTGCGRLNVGPRGQHNLCNVCVDSVLNQLPGILEVVS